MVARTLRAVVNISALQVVPAGTDADGKPAPEHFATFVGSGVIIDPGGIIVTNKHVIQNAARISVVFGDKHLVSAQLIAAASLVDLAVLRVAVPDPLPTLSFGDSDAVQVGVPVLAVGNPLGVGMSVSGGMVSALDRNLMRTPFDDFIQTDASINPGNSGGPLLDCASGKVIGINTALISNSKRLGSIGIGFAMPSNDVSYVVGKLLNPNAPQPNWIGIHAEDLGSRLAAVFGRADPQGAIITAVDPGSPAEHAAIAPGDIITSVDGRPMPDARAVMRAIATAPLLQPVAVGLWRSGRVLTLDVPGLPWPHLAALRAEVLASPASIARAAAVGLGLHTTALTAADRERRKLGAQAGVLVDRVRAGSQAYDRGIRSGDIIAQVNHQPATAPDVVTAAVAQARAQDGAVALLVRGEGGPRWILLDLGRFDTAQLIAPETVVSAAHAPGVQR